MTRIVNSSATSVSGLMRGMKRVRYHSSPFDPDEHEAREEAGDERNAQIEAHALRNLADANRNNASLKPEPLRQHGQEDPGIEAVEEHLKDAVDGNQPSNVIRVAFRKFIPDQHHCDAAGDADQDQAAHIGGLAPQENYGQEEHQHRADKPVLHERQPENALVAEDLAQLFVAHLRQRRKHHDDEADGDRDVCCPGLKAVDEAGRRRNEVADGNAYRHRKKDPERQKSVEKRELLSSGRSTDAALSNGAVDISRPRRMLLGSLWVTERLRAGRTSPESSRLL